MKIANAKKLWGGVGSSVPAVSWNCPMTYVNPPDPAAKSSTKSDEEWTSGWNEMTHAGVRSKLSENKVRSRFDSMRILYVEHAYALAKHHHAVRAPWSGPRKPDTEVLWPMRAGVDPKA